MCKGINMDVKSQQTRYKFKPSFYPSAVSLAAFSPWLKWGLFFGVMI